MKTQAKQATTKSTPTKKARFSFFAEVIAELRKVQWPSRQEALRLSFLVLIVCMVLGAIFWGLDTGFARLIFLLIRG